jgi:alpha-D-xyloside xylohydrolase
MLRRFVSSFIVACVLLLVGSCTNTTRPAGSAADPRVEKQDDGIVVAVNEGFLRLQVRSAEVIRVSFAYDRTFFDHDSIMVAPKVNAGNSSWKLGSERDTAILATSKLKTRVNLKTGTVTFVDLKNNTILAERPGSRSLEAAEVQGEKTYHLRQQWEPNADESLYGLGQNQLGLLDVKNYDIDLWQHNGTVIIPFLVSSKGYGILWDNTSFTRFGDLRDYAPIPAEDLMDKDGKAGGLTMGQFNNSSPTTLLTPSVTANITITGGGRRGGGGGGATTATTQASTQPQGGRRGRGGGPQLNTRWEGSVVAQSTGDYQFQTYSNGGIKVWIDNKLVIEHWRQSWLPWYDVARVHFDAGKQYPIKVEWTIEQGNTMKLAWKPPVPPSEAVGTSLWSEVGGGVDYYFCYGPDLDKVVAGYRQITGTANMLPSWAYGFWQSRDHYRTQQESIDIVSEFRKRNIPLDNIVQDWQYWLGASLNTVGSWSFDPARFPDPVAWSKAIHDQHAHLMISVWGWISSQSRPSTNYDQMLQGGYLLGTKGGQQARTFADFFNPAGGKMYWEQLKSEVYDKGIDAWWLDASEPDLASTPTLDNMREFMNPNGMGTGAKVLNAYPILESKAVYEGQRGVSPEKRVFILTRSAFAGQQRYSGSIWSGDSTSTWPAMRKQIMAGLGYCISGMPYWSMDIGGYQPPGRFVNPPSAADKDEWDELNTRWFQFGTFVPLMRVHGQGPYREMFNFGDAAFATMFKFDKLRYALMPYIYSLAGEATQNSGTIMRPLVMDFQSDSKAREIDDQYMFGPAFLVAPVTQYKARTRSVYLPKSAGWYDFWTGAFSESAQTIDSAAPFDSMPLYIKAGSIIPVGPDVQYTGEKPTDPITLYVYTGANADFVLYEDDGASYGYESGAFAKIPMHWDDTKHTLTIGKRGGEFPGMLKQRTFQVVFASKDKPVAYGGSPAVQVVQYDGASVQVPQQ